MNIKKAKTLLITSVKGGTGKTTTVLNLAGIYSKLDKKTLIIDFDLYGGCVAASLNIDDSNNVYHLVNDMSNNVFDNFDNYITPYNDKIDVISAPKDPRMASKVSSQYLPIILTRASSRYDVILLDTNHVIDEINLTLMDLSDQIIYIINNDPMDLKNMKTMVSIYNGMGKDNYKIILNESINRTRKHFTKYDIKNIIKSNIDYKIGSNFHIKNIDKYVLEGQILTLNKNIATVHKTALDNLKNIATNLIAENDK